MNKYENGKIYRLVCNITNKNYYGSTTQLLSKRLYDHKKNYIYYLKSNKKYLTSFEIIKEDNFDIVLVELFNCSCKMELEKRERFYIENNQCVNKYIPTRTQEEYKETNKYKENTKKYREINKDKLKNNIKEYREANKEKINKQRKQHREATKDKIKEYREANKEKHQQNREANKEKKKEYDKEYRKKQKENKKE